MSELDFSRCFFDPQPKNLLKTYPELQEISGDERLLRYIIALYDLNSPLVRKYMDIGIRKREAARMAGYDLRKEENELEAIYSFENEAARKAAVRFLKKYQFPREWYMICANEHTLYEYGERMLKPIDSEKTNIEKDWIGALADKEKLSAGMEAINRRIETGYKRLFGDDAALEAKQMTTAESMATSV
jgi:hypothetical protein